MPVVARSGQKNLIDWTLFIADLTVTHLQTVLNVNAPEVTSLLMIYLYLEKVTSRFAPRPVRP